MGELVHLKVCYCNREGIPLIKQAEIDNSFKTERCKFKHRHLALAEWRGKYLNLYHKVA